MDKNKNVFSSIGKWFKSLVKDEDGKEAKLLTLYKKEGTKSVLSSLISIVFGLIAGLIIMIIIAAIDKNIPISKAFEGFKVLLKGPFASKISNYRKSNIGNMIFYAVPLILCGLSVAIAYKTGLFNIGAPGQFLMGIIGSLLVALYIPTTTRFQGIMVWILALLVGILFAAVWAIIPGLLKALFNINEVIVCIMTNWIAANLTTWIFIGCTDIISKENTKSAYLVKPGQLNETFTPTLGLDKLFPNSYIDIGIVIAIIVAIVIYIIMNKTTFGYELKACGSNRNSAKYAGLNEKKNIVLSMAIAGALAGLGACLYYLNPGIELKYASQYSGLPSYGFNGIASAFLANCNPIGTIFSSLWIRYLNAGSEYLATYGFNRYVADIIIAIIIYIAGFTRIIRELLSRNKKKIVTEVVISKPEENDALYEAEEEVNNG